MFQIELYGNKKEKIEAKFFLISKLVIAEKKIRNLIYMVSFGIKNLFEYW